MKTSKAAAPALTDDRIDEAARESMRSVADFVLKMDRRQSNPDTQKVCPQVIKGKTAGHGALGVSGDGQWLICGKCEHRDGINRSEVEELEKAEAAAPRFAASVGTGGEPETASA